MSNKNVIYFLICLFTGSIAFAQGPTCSEIEPFCTDSGITFGAGVNSGDAEAGNDYDCLFTQPNPAWYFLEIEQPGEIVVDMTNSNNVDIDFILYGPFLNLGDALYQCGSYGEDLVVDCSYSIDPYEMGEITNAQTGEVYVLLITNFSNSPTDILALSTSSSTGTTNCDIILDCFINAGTIENEVCSNQMGSITGMVVTGGDGNYTYEWLDENGDFVSSDIDISNLEEGTYTFTVEDISGCLTTQDFVITNEIISPTINAGLLVNEVCSDQTGSISGITITDGIGVYTYEWIDENGDFVSADLDINDLTEGTYTLTVIQTADCTSTQDFVIINELLTLDASFQFASSSFCIEEENPSPINVATSGGTFSATDLTVNPTTGEIDLSSGSANTSYYIYYEIAGNCSSIDSFEITLNEVPNADFNYPQTDFCQADDNPSPTATNTGGIYSVNGGLNINPLTGELDLSTSVPGNSYEINYSTIGACPQTNIQTINVLPEPTANFEVNNLACAGDEVQVEFTGTSNFDWDFGQAQVLSGSGEGPYNLQYSSLGLYDIDVDLINLACSTDSYSNQIEIINLELTTASELAIDYGQAIDLTTSINSINNLTYTWSPAAFLSCTNCPSPIATPIETSTYIVSVSDNETGCSTSANILIEVEYSEPYVPNVFTPNEDNVNDEFKPEGEVVGDIEFAIYNRYGERVYFSTDLNNGWNGTYNAKNLNPDVFVWTLFYTLPNGLERIQKGNVTLIR